MPEALEGIVSKISAEDVVLVLGGVDTGKTYLTKKLWSRIGGEVVDGDVGQSDIGPPAVISRGDYKRGAKEGYFVGDVTPRGNFLQVITGIKLMIAKARRPCFIDTDGYIQDQAALAFKSELVNLAAPTKLLLLQKSNELAYYRLYERKGIEVIEVKAQSEFKKTKQERIKARERAFRDYFDKASIKSINISQVGFERLSIGEGKRLDCETLTKMMDCDVLGAWEIGGQATVIVDGFAKSLGTVKRALNVGYVRLINLSDLKSLLVGCLKPGGDLNLGILKDIDKHKLKILTPAEKVSLIQAGSIQINHHGKQLARVRL